MPRPAFELADIFRQSNFARMNPLPRQQLRTMNAITACRTPALGSHVDECGQCGHTRISYNSCRNRHCPKCQSLARAKGLEARKAELLPVEYFHVVFTLPEEIARLAFYSPKAVFDILSVLLRKPCSPSPAIPVTSAPRSASSTFSTP